jgi:hypothetical protein
MTMTNYMIYALTDRSLAIQILALLMWQNFNTKQGTQQQKNGRYGNPQHTFFTNGIYFVQANSLILIILMTV